MASVSAVGVFAGAHYPGQHRVKRTRSRGGPCAAGPPKKTNNFFDEADPTQGTQKLWGQSDKDVLQDKDTLLWNADWQSQLDAEQRKLDKMLKDKEEAEQREIEAQRLAKPVAGSGFLSLSRSLALDDMSLNVDLNERIVSREPASTSKPSSSSASAAAPAVSAADKDKAAVAEKLFFSKEEYERAGTNPDITMEEALKAFDKAFKKKAPGQTQYRYAPTKGERRQWAGSSKFSSGSTKKDIRDAMDSDEEAARARQEDLERYESLKAELVLLTLGTSGATAAMVYPVYGQPAMVSYLVGAFGGVVYLRLLAKSVDNTTPGGPQGIGGVIEGTVGGQRLLIPAILAMGWNRWNALIAPEVGFELQILPILAGFFTYKIATVVQVFKENLSPMMGKGDPSGKGGDF